MKRIKHDHRSVESEQDIKRNKRLELLNRHYIRNGIPEGICRPKPFEAYTDELTHTLCYWTGKPSTEMELHVMTTAYFCGVEWIEVYFDLLWSRN